MAKSTNPWTCFCVNVLAFPGLGTIMARRRFGYIQATIMLVGFVVFVGFLMWFFMGLLQLAMDPRGDLEALRQRAFSNVWIAGVGLGLCLVAWLWALFSSISILREGRTPPPLSHP